jgi:hypothetical protein
MRGSQRGGVIDPVACHRDHLAIGLEGYNDPQLLFRYDARKHLVVADAFGKLTVGHPLKLRSRDDGIGPDEPRLPGNAACGLGIVSGDHDDPDTSRAALGNRCGGALAQRIFEGYESKELWREVPLFQRKISNRKLRSCDAQNPKTSRCQRFHLGVEMSAPSR